MRGPMDWFKHCLMVPKTNVALPITQLLKAMVSIHIVFVPVVATMRITGKTNPVKPNPRF